MNFFRIGRWILPVVLTALLTGNALAAQKVLIIPGISEAGARSNVLAGRCLDGIKEAIAKPDVTHELLFVGLYGAPEADKVAMGKEAVAKAKQIKPDVIVLVGDDAVKYIGTAIDDIPVVFTYVYGSPDSLGLPKANITGVSRRSFAPDIWGLAKKLTNAKTVALIGKNTSSMVGVKTELMAKADALEKLSGVRMLDMHLCNTFEEWQAQVQANTAEMLYLTDTSMITKDGKEMSRTDLTRWTVDNSKVPVIAATDVDTKAGALLAILNDEGRWGQQAGEMAAKILTGTPVSQLPIETMQKGALVINVKTAKKYGLNVPYEILSAAKEIFEN